jgi:hypothetical protein
MRNLARMLPLTALAVALTACAGSSSTHSAGGSGPATSATAPASSSAPAGAGPLGVLPLPAGARPYSANTNRSLSLKAFVQQFYVKTAWADEEGLDARRGFKTGEVEGWTNTDGSEQIISIARFKTAQGAKSMYEGMTTGYTQHPKPATQLKDAAVGGLGWVNPTLDSFGNARVEIAAEVRDEVVIVVEYTAATPDAAGAKALMLKQYDSLKPLRPRGGSRLELFGVAVHRYDAQQVAAWDPEHTALQPLGHLYGAEGEQARGFRLDVVGFDVEVVARRVIDRLDDGDQSGQRLVQHGELRFRGHLPGRAAEGSGPERGRVGGVGFWCVDQQGVDTALVHEVTLPSYFCHTEMWLLLTLRTRSRKTLRTAGLRPH